MFRPSPASLEECIGEVAADIAAAKAGRAAIDRRIRQLKQPPARRGGHRRVDRGSTARVGPIPFLPPVCRHCGKEFINSAKLAIHERTHPPPPAARSKNAAAAAAAAKAKKEIWSGEQEAALVRLVTHLPRRKSGEVSWRAMVGAFAELTGVHRSEDSLRQYFGRRKWEETDGAIQPHYHGRKERDGGAASSAAASASDDGRPYIRPYVRCVVPPRPTVPTTVPKIVPKKGPKRGTAAKPALKPARKPAPMPTSTAAQKTKASKGQGKGTNRKGVTAGARVGPSTGGPKLARAQKLVLLAEVVTRVIKPATSGELIRLSDLNTLAVDEYERLHGHRLRCEKSFLRKLGFRVEEQNMCKTCGKPALTENCGNHYNNRAAGSTASVTKYNVVYATWIDRD